MECSLKHCAISKAREHLILNHGTTSILLKNWRKALSDVAQISGYELNACNGDEGELVNKVVEQVLKNVSKTPLNVAKHPTGLDEKLKDLERTVFLKQQSKQARVVGIVGLGGVGKTTLAKEFFNRHRSHYDRSCFLFDVRQNAAKNSLNSLQTTLLKDAAQLNVQINSTDQGIEELRKHLSSCHKTLIVLDDVDHIDQLDALFSPIKDTIHSGSLILVTSCDKDLLISSGIVEPFIYKQEGLNRQHSRELFCYHAFNQPSPVLGFEQMVDKFLDVCDGLPLSQKVIGALLGGKDLEFWEAQFNKISKQEQEHPGYQHRLWGPTDNLLHYLPDQSPVRGISMVYGNGPRQCLENLEEHENRLLSTNMSRLQVIRGEGYFVERVFSVGRQLPQLIYLCWEKFPFSSLPSSITTKNLTVLIIKREKEKILETLWQNESQAPLQLKELKIDANLLKIPKSIGKLQQLEKFVLRLSGDIYAWIDLEALPDEVCDIQSLKYLELKNCGQLTLLPESIGKLTNLVSIDLGGCCALQMLPDSAGELTKLQCIDISRCFNLRMLPDSIGKLTKLQTMNLSGCSNLQLLPDSVRKLTNLQHFDLNGCPTLQLLPDSFMSVLSRNIVSARTAGR